MAAVAVWALGGCGASGGEDGAGSTEATTRSETTGPPVEEHQQDLAQGETPGIASQLVEVDGYRYVDTPAEEIDATIEMLQSGVEEAGDPDFFRAFSFHSIVADDESQNTARTASGGFEVGYLTIIEFTEPPPAGQAGEVARLGMDGSEEIHSFDVEGTEVVVFETPDSVDSRYTLAWSRHGTQTSFDGASRASLERWARAYLELPEHEPRETDALAAALTTVEGYDYVNYWDEELNASVEMVVGDDDSSVHAVTDETGTVGILVLVDRGQDLSPEDLESVAADLNPGGATLRTTHGDVVVVTTESAEGEAAGIWSAGGILGIYFTPEGGDPVPFLDPYLAEL